MVAASSCAQASEFGMQNNFPEFILAGCIRDTQLIRQLQLQAVFRPVVSSENDLCPKTKSDIQLHEIKSLILLP